MNTNNENSSQPTSGGHVKTMNPGQIIDNRWRVKAQLGKGACGMVYKVEDKKRKGYCAAMKVEYDSEEYDRTLQIEVHVLNQMKNKCDVLKMLDCGKRKHYTYMVTTLCGKDLMALRSKIKRGFNDNTGLRVCVFTLYGLKQLHDSGFVHRDVKPGNIMTAANKGRDSRFMILIDFGMARSFVMTDETGRKRLRAPRKRIPLRGTIRYCSMNVHDRVEQGRHDDLIGLIYTIVAVTVGVPWAGTKDEKEVMVMKKTINNQSLFEDLPEELVSVFEYLKTLTYSDRPDYAKIYNLLMTALNRLQINFLDPYEWEDEEIERMTRAEEEEKKAQGKDPKEEESGKKTVVAKTPKAANSSGVEADEEKKKKDEVDPDAPQKTEVEKDQKLASSKDLVSSDPDVGVSRSAHDLLSDSGLGKDMDTAIEYDQAEYETKKALPKDRLQFLVYPSIAAKNFSEIGLPF